MSNKKDINKQIETLLSQAQMVLNETVVPIDERIQRVTDLYKQAETLAEEGGLDDKMYESLLADSAKFFYDYGIYKDALPRYTQLVALRESLYGMEDPITATAYHDIGETYRILCDYPKAIKYSIKALDIRKEVLGEKHRETADSYNDTGLVYFYQGDYEKASELILKAKDIREEIVGINHLDMAESYANIGLLSLKQEDYNNGLENYSKALDIFESTLGSENRKTATAYYGIGYAYYGQGNYSDALEYCSKALAVYEKVLGVKHPDTAIVYMALGYIHNCIGGYTKALDYVTKSLEINEEKLDDENINTAMSYSALGWVKYRIDDNQEVLDCYDKYLNITVKTLGLEHPDTAEAYYNMGFMLYLTDDNNKANDYYLKALEIYKKFPETEFIDKKIKEVETNMELVEVKDDEESKSTRDLFLETLTKIGCQYEIDQDEEYIYFAYQGENFVASTTNDNRYVRLWDSFWGHVELYDVEEFSRLRMAVNHANLNCSTMTIYTINEEEQKVDVHCKSAIPFMSEMPDLEDYLRKELGDFFNAHHLVGSEMAKLREKEQDKNIQTN